MLAHGMLLAALCPGGPQSLQAALQAGEDARLSVLGTSVMERGQEWSIWWGGGLSGGCCCPSPKEGGLAACRWLPATRDACSQGKVFPCLWLSADFQGCMGGLCAWKGSSTPCSPTVIQAVRPSSPCFPPGAEGELGIFHGSWLPAVFLFPLYGKEPFPVGGRRG